MKNIIKTLVLVMALVLVLVAFAGCEKECAHQGGEATCTAKAVCELCGEEYGAEPSHKIGFTTPVYATCTEGGMTGGSYCIVCEEVITPATEVAPLGHTHVEQEGKEATCTEDGYTAYNKCEVCGAIEGKEVIPATYKADENGVCEVCKNVHVATAEELVAALEAGKNVLLMNNIEMDAALKCPYGNAVGVAQKGGVLDGNGYTLTVKGSGNYYAIITYGGTIKNLTINSGFRAIVLYTPTEDVIIDNVTIYGDDIVYGFNTAEYPTLEGIDIVVKNSSICGWISFAGDYASVSFENCKFTQGVAYDDVIGRLVRPYLSTTFTNCEFVKNAYLDLSALNAGETVTLVGCTVDGVEVTVDVFTTEQDSAEIPFTYEAPEGVELVLTTVEGGVSFHRHGHVVTETVDSTCTEAGKKVYTCSCGDTYEEAGVDALGHADTNGDYKCDRCSTTMLPADGTALTIPQALAIAKIGGTSYTTQKYYITGIVTNVYNTTYGNLYLKDADGNEICIYGLYTWDKAVRYDKMEYKPVEGDELTVYTVLGMYGTTCQGKDAWMDEVVAHEHDYKETVTAPGCLTEGYTTHTCSICKASYVDGNTAALGHTTDAGTCERCGLEIGGAAPVVGTLATFDFGANGSAAHVDGNDFGSSKSWTVGTYTLSLTGMSKVFGPAYDAKGNSCIKLGTSKVVGTFTFTVPENVTEVIINVAGYKAATSTNVKVNGTQTTVKTTSNNGAYTSITIDTTTTKTITFTSVTYRCMIDSIVFNGTAQ